MDVIKDKDFLRKIPTPTIVGRPHLIRSPFLPILIFCH